jgi:enoyl-CoA hydratase/carnithine racemase
MAVYTHVQTRREGAVVVATLVNPPKNFMNARMVEEMLAVVDGIASDGSVRALIFTGGADGIFITHYDVGELSVLSDAVRERPPAPPAQPETERTAPELHPLDRLSLKLRDMPQPVIAAINGTAMGGGCELTLACDFRIMALGYQIGLPEVRVGILPGAGGTQRMTRLLGVARALELMLLGNTLEAAEAARLGLVHRAVAPERVLPEAIALAQELASRPRVSVAEIKRLIHHAPEWEIEHGLHEEAAAFMRTMRSDDASNLMRAYLKSDRPLNEQ